MKLLTLPIVLGFMLLLASAAQAQSSSRLLDQMLPPEFVLPNTAAIGLDDTQRQALNTGITDLQTRMRPLQAQMHRAEQELVTLLGQAKPDEGTLLAKYGELDALEGKVKVLRLRMTLLAKSVMTPEQHAKAVQLKSAQPTIPGDGSWVRDRLQRVRDGIARWKKEGRDVSRVNALWEDFQKNVERHWYQQANRSLDEALRLLESNQP